MDSWTLPDLFLFVASSLIVDLCGGGQELGVSYFTMDVTSLF